MPFCRVMRVTVMTTSALPRPSSPRSSAAGGAAAKPARSRSTSVPDPGMTRPPCDPVIPRRRNRPDRRGSRTRSRPWHGPPAGGACDRPGAARSERRTRGKEPAQAVDGADGLHIRKAACREWNQQARLGIEVCAISGRTRARSSESALIEARSASGLTNRLNWNWWKVDAGARERDAVAATRCNHPHAAIGQGKQERNAKVMILPPMQSNDRLKVSSLLHLRNPGPVRGIT